MVILYYIPFGSLLSEKNIAKKALGIVGMSILSLMVITKSYHLFVYDFFVGTGGTLLFGVVSALNIGIVYTLSTYIVKNIRDIKDIKKFQDLNLNPQLNMVVTDKKQDIETKVPTYTYTLGEKML